jgi:hypothetical protein
VIKLGGVKSDFVRSGSALNFFILLKTLPGVGFGSCGKE